MISSRLVLGVLCSAALFCGLALSTTPRAQPVAPNAPAYTADGRLEFPKAYRKWVYLTSGLDMSYLPNALRRLSTFGNVFVNPEAYDAFVESGTWPDKTVLVLEVRRAEQEASINRNGRSQGDIVRTEVHLKDNSRFEGGWAFFAFADETPAADDCPHGQLLLLPSGARRGRHHLRAVLSDAARHRADEENSDRPLPLGRGKRRAEIENCRGEKPVRALINHTA